MPLFVANWKMYKTFNESIAFVQEHLAELEQLAGTKHSIAIAPSFVCLDRIGQELNKTSIKLCAQDCAPFKSGAYTGEVDAASLAQVGCTYGIVGHSERRHHFNETNDVIAQKAEQLLVNNITPILCIGETAQEFEQGKVFHILEKQLASFENLIGQTSQEYCIAYEPIWAIGSGKVPDSKHLNAVFSWLSDRNNIESCILLYGGSVDADNAKILLQVPHVGGLLIGGASCDFQSLKKIVSLA